MGSSIICRLNQIPKSIPRWFAKKKTKRTSIESIAVQEPEIIDVSELMRDLTDDEVDLENDIDNKENIRPKTESENPVAPIEISLA
ncbi:hypothetical protein LOK49_LG05G01633 [Camellia lanceoleosa]|uniref:Uncharacterized protein n=1 Tax=Camellia lanceoleosa TaxID=1840588 RepID=A0ACC0HPJ5_9ERIC|nr:hypothetical protein LOK49_LG05G01633 [Camellia lanceoleosa]